MPDPALHASDQSWLQRHWRELAWTGVGILIGLVAGFISGGYLACAPSESCEFKADLAGALGTWVGGLGTIGALVFAIIAFRSEEASRRRDEQSRIEAEAARRVEAAEVLAEAERERVAQEQARRREIDRDRTVANKVTTDAIINSHTANEIMMFSVIVRNRSTNTPVHGLGGELAGWGPLDYLETLAPGQSHSKVHQLGFGRSRASMPMPAPEDRVAWRDEVLQQLTISFDLNGRRWEKRGTAPAEPVSGDD